MAIYQSGGAFIVGGDYQPSGTWDFSKATVTGLTVSSDVLVLPTIKDGLTATGSVSNDFSGSTGTFKTSSGANTLSGAVTVNDATTPSVTTASGKTNTGSFIVSGKTSGTLKLTTADATAQAVTVTAAAQTTGASTLTIPDQAGTSRSFVFDTLAQTLTNKTLTAPVIGVATGTSLAVTGLLTSSSATAGIGYATGAGGTGTQGTDKTTTVTLSPAACICGTVTTTAATLNAATIVSFDVTDTDVVATDRIIVNHVSGGTLGAYTINAQPGTSKFTINLRNNTAGNLSEALVIGFSVIKGVTA